MEQNINIAEILKDKPKGTELYSPLYRKVTFSGISNTGIFVKCQEFPLRGTRFFFSDGRCNSVSECLLFPSKVMRDWTKFAWKKGDVLVNKDRDTHVIFEKFTDDTYTTFTGKHYRSKISKNGYEYVRECSCDTESFSLETEDAAKAFLNTIEEKLGGKLNRETLEIEKPAFKIGSLYVFNDEDEDGELTIIGKLVAKDESEDFLKFGYQYEIETEKLLSEDFDLCISEHKELREATESEASLFESAYTLWKKSKEQPAFKPFDKVLVKASVDGEWHIDLFECMHDSDIYPYRVMSGLYGFCIHYEGNEHLLGTKDNPK